jgi:hypothetical protein
MAARRQPTETERRKKEGLLDVSKMQSKRLAELVDRAWLRVDIGDRRELLGRPRPIEVRDSRVRQQDMRVNTLREGYHVPDIYRGDGLPAASMSTEYGGIYLFRKELSKHTDAVVMALFAHELAHVFLRHAESKCNFKLAREYQPQITETLWQVENVNEWLADLQAYWWGFKDELPEMWAALEVEPPPWYFDWEQRPFPMLTGPYMENSTDSDQ